MAKATIEDLQPLTEEKIKSSMLAAFKKVKLDTFSDILRIRKPQPMALLAAQLLCKVVNAYRGGSQRPSNDPIFSDWKHIQDFIHRKPNVMKFHQEISSLIYHMVLSKEYISQLSGNQLKNHVGKLVRI